ERAAGEPGDVPAVPRQREKHAKRALAFRDRRGLLLVRCSAVQRRRFGSRGGRYREAKARSRPYRCYPSTPVNDSSSTSAVAINGEAAALAVDRAVDELRRGRAIHLAEHGANGHGRGLVVAAVEAVPQSLLERLAATGAPVSLLMTPERAHALGLADGGGPAVALPMPASVTVDARRRLGGAGPGRAAAPVDSAAAAPRPPCADVAAAGFRLAKAGRLLPALVAIEAASPPDASLLSLGVADVAAHALPARPRLKRMSQSRVPLEDALDCELALFRDEHGLGEHVAVLIGTPDLGGTVPVRLHSACLTGDLLGSLRCDCGEQLRRGVRRIAELG